MDEKDRRAKANWRSVGLNTSISTVLKRAAEFLTMKVRSFGSWVAVDADGAD